MLKNKKIKVLIIIAIIIALIAVLVIIGISIFSNYSIGQLNKMSYEDTIKYTAKDKKDAVITVGILKDGNLTFSVYGENGKILPQKEYTYEIGSITKTFTAALINKAIDEGKANLNDTIDKYLELPKGRVYPALADLLTHTSGYKGYYMEWQMVPNHLHGVNDFYCISKDMILDKVKNIKLKDKEYSFKYSNFGYAVLGLVLENIYHQDYTDLMNNYAKKELGLENTRICDGTGDLDNYWDWAEQDAYMPAGALYSNISDMMEYAKMQLDNQPSYFSYGHNTIKNINVTNSMYAKMGINMDSIGMGWIVDNENNFVWHNGGTGDFNSFIGFCKDTETAVVVLSNLPPEYRIPATVTGIKLLKSIQK